MGDDETRASVDDGAWDGSAAMSICANADDPAAAYAAVCAGRRDGDPALQSSWALPHHMRPGMGPNAAGVRNSLSRLPQTQGLINRSAAQSHLEAHMREVQGSMMGRAQRPPRDMLVRSQAGDFEVREADGQPPTLVGHFGVFDQWTEIRSAYEGRFMERMAPGAFARSLANNRSQIKVTFQHGKDPSLGDQVLGLPSVLEEDRSGGYAEVPLFDGIPPLIVDGLRKNAYGMSLRMRVVKDDWQDKPKRSATNPEGLPERTITEAQVYEFGPVTYPAYAGATATVRSETDDYLLSIIRSATADDALPDAGPEDLPHSDEGTREEPPADPPPPAAKPTWRSVSRDDLPALLSEKR